MLLLARLVTALLVVTLTLLPESTWAQQRSNGNDVQSKSNRDDALLNAYWIVPEIIRSCRNTVVVELSMDAASAYIVSRKLEERRGAFAKALFTHGYKEEIGKVRNLKGEELNIAFCRMARTQIEELAAQHGIRLVNWK